MVAEFSELLKVNISDVCFVAAFGLLTTGRYYNKALRILSIFTLSTETATVLLPQSASSVTAI